MVNSKKYLTKSKFKTGHDCANKLFFMQDSDFASINEENAFLSALADGGFQVGELAKLMHPEGVRIQTIDKEDAKNLTSKLMSSDIVTIFEAAFGFGPLFIRADVVRKAGSSLHLMEVKSKTFDSERHSECGFFTKKRDKIDADWEPYLMDVAFQAYVISKAYPKLTVTCSLVLLDKQKRSTTEGLNQRFVIVSDSGDGPKVRVTEDTTAESVGETLLRTINVDAEINHLRNQQYSNGLSFTEYVMSLAGVYETSKFPDAPVTRHCKNCEYRIPEALIVEGKKSGFEYCFKKLQNLKDKDFDELFIFDVRNNWRVADALMPSTIFAKDLTEEDLKVKSRTGEPGWSESERKIIQIDFSRDKNKTLLSRDQELKSEIESWAFPYHFIDFETITAAIPFNKGRRAYEQMAFQFSHHKVTEDGKISHATQYLNLERGKFPNFDFLRALKRAIGNDNGTVFRYHNHENTVLNDIRRQILDLEEPLRDSDDLIEFIDSITNRKKNSKIVHEGARAMVDLCQVVDRYYFHRDMGGRTSIKKVLPAILNDSKYLQQRYSQPLFDLGITSLSRGNVILITKDDEGTIVDPYKALPPVFDDISIDVDPEEDGVLINGELCEGGAAMMAYARLQFSEVSDHQRKKTEEALLRYCELDTLAMVLIWEYWAKDLLLR
jgi:hypothetical protein